MPVAPSSVCTAPDCRSLAESGRTRCSQHHAEWVARRAVQQVKANRNYNDRRPVSDKFYGTNAWKIKSQRFRAQHPLCQACEDLGLVQPSTMVDHKIPYRQRPDLAMDDGNLRALCWQCHNRIGLKVRG
jgi:5-methylcytosine-specific restriction protein A